MPLRIIPTTTIGATIVSSRISGCRRIHSWARSRIRRLCTMPDRRMCVADVVEVGAGVVGQQHAQRLLEVPGPQSVSAFLALRVGQHRADVEGAVAGHAVRTSDAG